ncbi:hypothetical protein Enr13x_35170 [Stieleria neptunia]|uniref:Uncharacterized protein n=1 Tax=Stieleria neptunia TaxID=2527979 RepID=A0A518HS35_9BACT|nr:hypothetical protein [Stieleria neptunia]QDV43660.1 hypothetical protein Enr13x_35170 [Stieleria neptunia]
MNINRRDAIRVTAASLGSVAALPSFGVSVAEETTPTSATIQVLHPRARVPLSFIIDDSTCLVNMGHFCMPQFAHAWPERDVYQQPWREWPREIPDRFVREFGEWCAQHDVKGKYSIVPYPACVGWLDRTLPGWSRQDLDNSLALVRDLMMPNWDIHPEMITHTRVIDLKTGRPMAEVNAGTMENSYPQTDISTDHLTEYLAYALRILKNCGLNCDGITTPGGFGNRVKEKLPVAAGQAVRDVYGSELPHYFKYVKTGDESTEPQLEFDGDRVLSNLTMNVPAGTGDWFGSWEGSKVSDPDRYCTPDATSGRMVELIERGQPAVMLCHWPGMYCNGTKTGFNAFKRVVQSLASRFGDQTLWMKVSEIGRYWAAKEMTSLTRSDANTIELNAPLACENFTVSVGSTSISKVPSLSHVGSQWPLQQVASLSRLQNGTFVRVDGDVVVCLDLPKGASRLSLG